MARQAGRGAFWIRPPASGRRAAHSVARERVGALGQTPGRAGSGDSATSWVHVPARVAAAPGSRPLPGRAGGVCGAGPAEAGGARAGGVRGRGRAPEAQGTARPSRCGSGFGARDACFNEGCPRELPRNLPGISQRNTVFPVSRSREWLTGSPTFSGCGPASGSALSPSVCGPRTSLRCSGECTGAGTRPRTADLGACVVVSN